LLLLCGPLRIRLSALRAFPMATSGDASQPKLMLPAGALQGDQVAEPPAPSPNSRPPCTPAKAASTQWRRQACPYPPTRKAARKMTSSNSALSTPMAVAGPAGLLTPANLWPSPGGTPVCGSQGLPAAGAPLRVPSLVNFPSQCQSQSMSSAGGGASPFSVDATPIHYQSGQTDLTGLEWMMASLPLSDASTSLSALTSRQVSGLQASAPPTPMSQIMDRAQIFEAPPLVGEPPSPHAAMPVAGKTDEDFFHEAAIPDGGPGLRMRDLGA